MKVKNKRLKTKQIRHDLYVKYRFMLNQVAEAKLPLEPEFKDFENFYRFVKPTYLKMLGKYPGKKVALIRLDPKKGFIKNNINLTYKKDLIFLFKEKSQIKFNTNKQKIPYDGEFYTTFELAEKFNRTPMQIRSAYSYALENNDITLFNSYLQNEGKNRDSEKYEYMGEYKSLKELQDISKEIGAHVKRQTIHARIKKLGYSVEDAVNTPTQKTTKHKLEYT